MVCDLYDGHRFGSRRRLRVHRGRSSRQPKRHQHHNTGETARFITRVTPSAVCSRRN